MAEQTNNLPKVVGLIAIARWMPTSGVGKSGLIEHSQLALVTYSWIETLAEALRRSHDSKNSRPIVFDKMAAADLMETAEAFSRAKLPITNGHELRRYQPLTLGIGGAPCVTECGVIVTPLLDFRDALQLDTIIVRAAAVFMIRD